MTGVQTWCSSDLNHGAAFAAELADAVNGLVAKYHDEAAPGGRPHRFVVALHPTITHTKESQP